jgi:hypothetical protein
MTLTASQFTKVDSYSEANKRVRVYDVVLTSGANYATGGDTILPAYVGLNKIMEAVPHGIARATSGGATGRTLAFDYTAISGSAGAIKMQVYTTASAEAANNSDQSTQSCRITFRGR